jgi:hypothetical protein
MTLLPRAPLDMVLAPVAAQIDLNLQQLRDRTPGEIDYELQLQLDRPTMTDAREERAEHVLRAALRNIDRHGWEATITEDGCRLRLTGGSVSLDLGLGASVMTYIDGGVTSSLADGSRLRA